MARTVSLRANRRRCGQYLITHNLTGSIFFFLNSHDTVNWWTICYTPTNLTELARFPQVAKVGYILNLLYPLPYFISYLLWWRQSFNFQYNSFLIQSLCSVFNVSTVHLFLSLLLLSTRGFPGYLGNRGINFPIKFHWVYLFIQVTTIENSNHKHWKRQLEVKMACLSVRTKVALSLTIWKTCSVFLSVLNKPLRQPITWEINCNH